MRQSITNSPSTAQIQNVFEATRAEFPLRKEEILSEICYLYPHRAVTTLLPAVSNAATVTYIERTGI